MSVQAIPAGRESLMPYLVARDAAKAIEFYTQLFDGTVLGCMYMPGSTRVMHAELKISGAF